MPFKSLPNFLNYVLWADAASCLACGLLQVALPGSLQEWLGLPAALLTGTGVFLLSYGAIVAFLAARLRGPSPIIWILVAGNIAWAVACFYLLLGGGMQLTTLGEVYVAVQAFTVAALAQLQYIGMRRGRAQLA